MTFFLFLKALDSLLYEIALWLVLYPKTLWRTLRHPRQMMEYGATQLTGPPDKQFQDTLSPPIFLLLSVLVMHGIGRALVGESKLIESTKGLAGLISDNTSMILLRVIAFTIFPVVMALRTVVLQRGWASRDTLEAPFYAQCYGSAPFAMIYSLAATAIELRYDWGLPLAAAMILGATAGYLWLEAGWFARVAGKSWRLGLWTAIVGYAQGLLMILMLFWLLGGRGA